MKTLRLVMLGTAGAGILALAVLVLPSLRRESSSTTPAKSLSVEVSTPADAQIQRAQRAIGQAPNRADGYNQLASAYLQKARETDDSAFHARAEAAITRSVELEADNYDAIKLRAKLLLIHHRFREALETAQQAQKIRPDDHDVYGQITDALVELGEYTRAVQAAQQMVDLRPDTASYARVSYLRSLHGDTAGAVTLMRAAVKAANPKDPESIAWCRVHLGNELINNGEVTEAEREFDRALETFPDYRLALEGKARARVAAGDVRGAIAIYRRQQAKAPSADVALALGDLYTHLGENGEASNYYQVFETLEQDNVAAENSWRHMINYWLDHDKNLQQALTLAQKEYETRKDIFTCDALAWALYKNGRIAEAQSYAKQALRLGTRDGRINYHAGMIYKSRGMRTAAMKFLKLAIQASSSDLIQIESAKKTLNDLTNTHHAQL